jgi:maltooligosyltrehalose trehalohydrolase
VEVVFEDGSPALSLEAEEKGYFAGGSRRVAVGAKYRFRLDGGSDTFPDPASRFQPEGPHGPSQVVDPRAFAWTDHTWGGVGPENQVVYELHVGTFTKDGTWSAACAELQRLAALGITVVEVMPIADFPGRFGWGYDGVCLFAPTRLYGSPDDLRHFVDTAHGLGLGVILDVVYNHFGPDGNFLGQFSDTYFTDRYSTDWGPAINYDGEGCSGTRDFIASNAGYWVDEYHFDGLRLDATQNIYDESPDHIVAKVCAAVRQAARGRATFICAENESQDTQIVRPPSKGGYGADAVWNDDYHHACRVALTGRAEAYYTDYGGTPQELLSAIKWGYLYQGQHYAWQKKPRGTPALDLCPINFVAYLENHDQVANTLDGARLRLRSSPGRYRALVALTLLGPATPLLFQGEEFGSTAPFLFFADHHPELAALVRKGRREFLLQFPSVVVAEPGAPLPSPDARETFDRSKLRDDERATKGPVSHLYHDLLALRRETTALRASGRRRVDGAVLASHAFALRVFGDRPEDEALMVVNLGPDLELAKAPEPLLAPPFGVRWDLRWSSDDPRYGGEGASPPEVDGRWRLPGESLVLFTAKERT